MANSPPEARPAGQRDVADVGRRGPGDGLVDDEGAVLEVGAALLLHLPKVLQRLHHVDCNKKIDVEFLHSLDSHKILLIQRRSLWNGKLRGKRAAGDNCILFLAGEINILHFLSNRALSLIVEKSLLTSTRGNNMRIYYV